MKARELLISIWIKNDKDWDDTYHDIKHKIYPEDKDMENIDFDNYITILDEDYPQHLKQVYRPPFVLEKKNN